VRQAYDDFAQPVRLAAELAVLPAVMAAVVRRRVRVRWLALGVAAVVALAEVGRRRAGGARVYPRTAALWAPLWLAERAICVWLAVGARLRGGVRYSDGRLRRAAHSTRALRARVAASAR
jgi:hypothetical protein